jgi:pyrroloquinoline-quinone synthase
MMTADVKVERMSVGVLPARKPAWDSLLPDESIRALRAHPLLCALAEGDTNISTLQELLAQHHFYCRHFTSYLCLLIARLPKLDDVRSLMNNLLEELGADQPNGTSHAELFLRSMRAAGINPHSSVALKGTKALTSAMFHYCRRPDPLDGLAAMCLGAEAIVPFIYSPIIAAMNHLDLPFEASHFFELHVAEDEDHAAAMLAILLRLIGNDPVKVARAREVAADMVGCRLQFLDDVWNTTSVA